MVRTLVADARMYVLPVDCDYFNKAIKVASKNGYLDVVEFFLKDPMVDPADYCHEAVRKACENGHFERNFSQVFKI